ncbi:MAG: Smr/MutS family protein [Candidatus Binatia bacterium]
MSRSSSNDGRGDRPFNNPFRDQLGKLKRSARDARRRARAEAAEASARPDAAKVAQPDEETTFQQAMGGVVPLEGTGRVAGGPPAAPMVVHSAAAEDPTADEHFDVRFSDRFIRGRAAGVSRETIAKLERGEFSVRSHVDLHGLPLDDAKVAVDELISRCQRRGDRCVLVITGKGNNSPRQFGVLRERIPEWLARGPSSRCVLGFVTARPCDGGEGALYVLLRRHAARKNRIDVEAGGGA